MGGRKISNAETAIDGGAGEGVEGYVYPQDAGEGARGKQAAEVVAVRPLDRSKGGDHKRSVRCREMKALVTEREIGPDHRQLPDHAILAAEQVRERAHVKSSFEAGAPVGHEICDERKKRIVGVAVDREAVALRLPSSQSRPSSRCVAKACAMTG